MNGREIWDGRVTDDGDSVGILGCLLCWALLESSSQTPQGRAVPPHLADEETEPHGVEFLGSRHCGRKSQSRGLRPGWLPEEPIPGRLAPLLVRGERRARQRGRRSL